MIKKAYVVPIQVPSTDMKSLFQYSNLIQGVTANDVHGAADTKQRTHKSFSLYDQNKEGVKGTLRCIIKRKHVLKFFHLKLLSSLYFPKLFKE